jgi:probable O-glycosylation ligase (exosortase A-associated)
MNTFVFYIVLSFFFLDYIRPGDYVPALNAAHLNSIVPVAAILGTLLFTTPVPARRFLSEPNTWLLGVLLGLLCVSTLFATITDFAFTVTKNVFAYILVYWILVRQIGDYKRLKTLFLTLTLVHLIIAVLNPELFAGSDDRVGINSGGFLGDGNDFSLSVNICVPLLLFVMLESKRLVPKILLGFGLFMLVFAIVATKSRGGTLAFGAVMLYFWLGSRRKVLTAAVFTLVVAVVLMLAPASYFERMRTMTDTEEGSSAGRIEAWREGVKMAVKNPLMGAGAGHFPLAFGTATEGRWKTAHSIYFLLLGELGLPGLGILLALIFYNLFANRRLKFELRKLPPEQAATAANVLNCTSAALIAYASGGAFLSAAYYPHMYVLLGMHVAGRYVIRQQIEACEHAGNEQELAVRPVAPMPITPGAISPEWVPRPQLYTRLDRDPFHR